MANELKVYTETAGMLPAAQEMRDICSDLSDIKNVRALFGAIAIAPANAGIFKVREPGADKETAAGDTITCVIVGSHDLNMLWGKPFAEHAEGERPVCQSNDGVEGVDQDGVVHRCDDCPHNVFGENGERKECRNGRQLYVLRPGDVFPMLFKLPASALKAFDNYRVRVRLSIKRPLHAVVTRVTLASAKSRTGVSYSQPVFEAVGTLPVQDATQIKDCMDGFIKAAKEHGVLPQDGAASAADDLPADAASGCTVLPDADLPENF